MAIEMLKDSCSTNGPENPNMMYTREDTIRSGKVSELGCKTVGIQVTIEYICKLVNGDE